MASKHVPSEILLSAIQHISSSKILNPIAWYLNGTSPIFLNQMDTLKFSKANNQVTARIMQKHIKMNYWRLLKYQALKMSKLDPILL